MTVHLMNAANMPQTGTYTMNSIAEEEFFNLILHYHAQGLLKSYIGYPQNIQYIEWRTGIWINKNRDQTRLQDGDLMLIMKLPYRPQNKDVRAQHFRDMDFDFFLAEYQASW